MNVPPVEKYNTKMQYHTIMSDHNSLQLDYYQKPKDPESDK